MRERVTKLVPVGQYVAEVGVQLIETDSARAPYYALEDVRRLEAVREALEARDLEAAAKLGRLYTLTPVITD